MKKSLIALAVLAASGVAMAQSSVTLYGVVDAGFGKQTGSSAQMFSAHRGNNGDSRLGVRGVEDLGGGLKASFVMEQGINVEDGANTAAKPFQRNAWLGLQGGFGRVQMGRTLSPSFYGVAAWELTGAANYTAVGNQFGWGGNATRHDSMFQYTCATGGFSSTLGYVFKQDNGGNAKYDLNAIYQNGPIVASVVYGKTNGAKASWGAGGSYDFGSFKVAGGWHDPVGPRKGFSIGATVPVGAFALTADIARVTSGGKETDYLLEAKYALSKRTFAYGALHRDGGPKVTTSSIGIRHNF